jgi:peroxiredoxin
LDFIGNELTLHSALGALPSVVAFYRGAWCPYCSSTLKAYRARLVPELQYRHVSMLALSQQLADGKLRKVEANDLDSLRNFGRDLPPKSKTITGIG